MRFSTLLLMTKLRISVLSATYDVRMQISRYELASDGWTQCRIANVVARSIKNVVIYLRDNACL
ncbi:hypothetical protein PITCH_A580024 [uncultured Desulfobacterium sp.]|uniref:Uncharacterized protein n=1 Tax=uncultured Desulfobacterium sp. TaxID=201089 RepID=A0A445N199_9BACT|nr:hypothetical protein PITCH_A580024 [uncultured Desulfobacterium sp.]